MMNTAMILQQVTRVASRGARSAPSMTNLLFRNTPKMNINMNMNITRLPAINIKSAAFSTDEEGPSEPLPDLLQREIEDEVGAEETSSSSMKMPEDLAELKSTILEQWTIQDGSATGPDGATIKMFKKDAVVGSGAKVVLSFHCQDTIEDEDEAGTVTEVAESIFGGGGDEDDDDDELSSPLQFQVTVSRAGKFMRMNCISQDAEASVEGITITNSDDGNDDDGHLYRGPILEDLPEDMTNSLDDYLREECGVNEDVAAFISMYADHREQVEYVRWLEDVKKIVE